MSVKRDDRLKLLHNVWLFSACSRAELSRISSISTPLNAKAGQVLATEGQPGREFFVIVEGTAEVFVGGNKVGDLGPGSFFGEMALLDGGPRTATVTAATPMSLLILSRGEFDDLIDAGMPSVARKMLTAVGERLRSMDDRLAGRAESVPG